MSETPVETLRRAAKRMRERAEAAWPGPWDFESEVGGFGPVGYVMMPLSPHHPGARTGLTSFMPLGSQDAKTAEHIASMHPGVALAVAAWLSSEARHSDGGEGGIDEVANLPYQVALTYLGEENQSQ